jgi:beta-lactamase class A
MNPDRRLLLSLGASSLLLAGFGAARARSAARGPGISSEALAQLERTRGGRLGVCVFDAARPHASLEHRADERFGLCSTFKLLLAAALLREDAEGRIDADESLAFSEKDRVPHMPVIERALASGQSEMSLLALAEATQKTSDNAAANLLIRRLGGPQAVTALWRAMGDEHTRIDRYEPEMNRVPEGELRDTTTPRAMASTVARLFTDETLLPADARERLAGWMRETRTGLNRLRAGIPEAWRPGDKTGTAFSEGMPNKHNDVAVAWPPGRAPLVIAAYYEADDHYPNMREQDNAVLADVGRIAAAWAG